MSVSDDAYKEVKKKKKQIIDKFANIENYPAVENPFTIFMAGSPGAGKTEFSEDFDPDLFKFVEHQDTKIVRIDADEIRHLLDQFTGSNASEVQRAASKGVDFLFDHVQKKCQNAIVDGTFANREISFKNVDRALGRNRSVGIFYIYQTPQVAWEFTKKRNKIEKRDISKQVFINAFFSAKDNVNEVKEMLKDKIMVDLIIKNYENKDLKYHINIQNIDHHIKESYTAGQLKSLLED